MKSLRKIKSPAALATFGAFFVPEPLGACVVLAAAIWWSYRKLIRYRSRGGAAPSLSRAQVPALQISAPQISASQVPASLPASATPMSLAA
jgi:hypothetical protein